MRRNREWEWQVEEQGVASRGTGSGKRRNREWQDEEEEGKRRKREWQEEEEGVARGGY